MSATRDGGSPEASLPSPSALRAAEDRVSGLRAKMEYFYRRTTELEHDLVAQRKAGSEREKQLLLDVIQVADSFDDVLNMFEASEALKAQQTALSEASAAFETTYEALKEFLRSRDVFQVPILGQGYGSVQFEGIPIQNPWGVMGALPSTASSPLHHDAEDSKENEAGTRGFIGRMAESLLSRRGKKESGQAASGRAVPPDEGAAATDAKAEAQQGAAGPKVVRKVVRSLWVRREGSQVTVLRRAQVMY